jgi:uncharacterized protein (DUF427 family)
MSVIIRETNSGARLAQGDVGSDVMKYEGNWYFAPESVQRDLLRVSDRTYTCPYKGTCNWVDFVSQDGKEVKDVAWVYPDPKPGHELIRSRYGFYAGSRGPTREEQAS